MIQTGQNIRNKSTKMDKNGTFPSDKFRMNIMNSRKKWHRIIIKIPEHTFIMEYNSVSDRIIRFMERYSISQLHRCTHKDTGEIVDEFCRILQQIADQVLNKDVLIITGNFNAKIGECLDQKPAMMQEDND